MIWCLFWELDEDEDSVLQKDDLMRYGSYGLSKKVVDRLWALRRKETTKASCGGGEEGEWKKDGMGYDDFVCFLLAEEDKQSAPALQYWFHVLDVDGDGYLSTKDMWYFYEELQVPPLRRSLHPQQQRSTGRTRLSTTPHTLQRYANTRTGPPRGDERGGCALRGDH